MDNIAGGDGIEFVAPRLAMASRAATLYMSVITLLELEKGILLPERCTPPQGDVLRI